MSIKLNAQSGGSVALDAPTQTTGSADVTFKLPVADGTAGQVLKTDGNGNLSWVNDQAGKILQVVQNNGSTSISATTNTTTIIAKTITPVAAGSKILVNSCFSAGANPTNNSFISSFLIRGTVSSGTITGSTIFTGFHGINTSTNNDLAYDQVSLCFLDTPTYTLGNSITYTLAFKNGSVGTAYVITDSAPYNIILSEVGA